MIKAIIIDDVERARAALKADIYDYFQDVAIIGEANGVETGEALIRKVKPELVFLDIQMNDGNGFDLLKRFPDPDFHVIFTTALDNFAIKAFKYSALDYLLKPISHEDLIQSLNKYKQVKTSLKTNPDFSLLLENIKGLKQGNVKKIALNTQERVFIVNISDIIRCQSDSNYTQFFLESGQKILVTKTMKEFEKLLEPHGFIRPHQSHLVCLDFVSEFVKTEGGFLKMKDNSEIPVSQRKKEEVLRRLINA